jgi:hypothetical protein
MPSSGIPFEVQVLTITPVDATENDPFTIEADFEVDVPNEIILGADSVIGDFTIGESVIGDTSGAVGTLKSFDGTTAVIVVPDDNFVLNETVIGSTSQASFTVSSIEQVWNAL